MDDKGQYESDLIEQIKRLPAKRLIEHCGSAFEVSRFDIYARCPACDAEVKVRAFSGVTEIEDVFDAVLEWMLDPSNREVADKRMLEIKNDSADLRSD